MLRLPPPIAALAALLGGTLACAGPPPRIEMQDVSLVWPLAAGAPVDDDGFVRAGQDQAHGVLLPRDLFDAVPALTRTDEPDDLYESLQVVGARLDPCFREGGADAAPCRPMVRLVMQPVRPSLADGQTAQVARDASLHVFYDAASADEITAAVAALARARDDADIPGERPLGVHPLLAVDDGRARVAQILAPLLGEARITRVTSISVHATDAAWTFAGLDVVDRERVPIVIPATGGAIEQHALSDGAAGTIHASVLPALAAADDITLLLDDAAARAATPAERQAAYDAAARIENPTLHDPGTIDCVSCHLAAVARTSARARETMAESPDLFTSDRHDLTTSPFASTQVVRALGYRFGELALSPRVVHESAAVADAVDALLHP